MALVVKNLPGNARDVSSIPGLGRSSGGGNGKSSPVLLLGKVHGQRSLLGSSHGVQSQTPLSAHTHTHTHTHTQATLIYIFCLYFYRTQPNFWLSKIVCDSWYFLFLYRLGRDHFLFTNIELLCNLLESKNSSPCNCYQTREMTLETMQLMNFFVFSSTRIGEVIKLSNGCCPWLMPRDRV